jgi:N-methylhydantoinase A
LTFRFTYDYVLTSKTRGDAVPRHAIERERGMAWRIGVDSGGTFTDVCLFDDVSGSLKIWKVSSTPSDPSVGIVRGVEEGLAEAGGTPHDVAYFGHGTTVATNALLQHRGVKTALVTTQGFRDLLEIGRQKRPDLYDLNVDKPQVLVPRDLRIEAPERMLHDGRVDLPLDEVVLRERVRALRDQGVEALAICFLYGYAFSAHEAAAMRIIEEELPDVFVSASHEVAPEFREFERLSTTVVNAYLGPVMHRYIERLSRRLTDVGVAPKPHLTQSNGGVISFDMAAKVPVRTLLSGPSTGVIAAQEIGRLIGVNNLITFDMGGTSSDVALLHEGKVRFTNEAKIEGYPIKAPMLDIHTVGAGGGSIAHIDSGGLLKVGPQSAGADPGPVCYDKGSTEPSVTDANVVLQTLHPTHLLAGRLPIRRDLAVAAVARVAERLGLQTEETAQGIISIVTANMARAIRVISVQRGYDPRDYALVAFGGAGPLHAARLAAELDIKRVVVPLTPGILCALGILLTDLRADFSVTRIAVLDDQALPILEDVFGTLGGRVDGWFVSEGVEPSRQSSRRSVDMRYLGQSYEMSVVVPDEPLTSATVSALREAFEVEHQRMYGFVDKQQPVQIVTCRAEAIGQVPKASFTRAADSGPDASHAIVDYRDVWLKEAGGRVSVPVYSRERLKAGNRFEGPAIVEQFDATTVVLPKMTALVEPHLNLILEFH